MSGNNASASGETLGLIGQSGSGKTTISKCIIGFYKNYHGKIKYDGINVEEVQDLETISSSSPIEYADDLDERIVSHYGEELEERGDDYYAKGGEVDSQDIADKFMDVKYEGHDWWDGDNYKDENAEGRHKGAIQMVELIQGKGTDIELTDNLTGDDRDLISEILEYPNRFADGGETATVSIIYNDIPENHRIIGFSHKGEEVILDELVMTDRERAEYSAKEGYMKGMDRNEFWKKYQRVDFQTAD